MKLKSMLFILCFGLFNCVFAETASYTHATNPDPVVKNQASNSCAVYIQNRTGFDYAHGGYDIYISTNVDNYYRKFIVYPNHDLELSLYYDGYCHAGFGNIRIESYYSPTYNTGWVESGSIVSKYYLKDKVQVTSK